MSDQDVRVVGRYALYQAIAAGGMATVHLGRLLGPVGFSRTVAIKRLHAQFAADPEFVSMFLDEARLAARIRHPNVVPTLDVVATGGELFLVMDYVPGESLSRLSRALQKRQQTLPLRILSATMAGVLHGLHAAHEAKDERGNPLGIVHRDVSPQNVLIGIDGVPRVLDFGVAKAAGRIQTTKEGQIKGKLAYMPPEQLRGGAVGRQTDIYAAGVILWELLSGQRLFAADNEGAIVAKVLEGRVPPPSQVLMASRRATVTDQTMRSLEALDATILKALSMRPEERHATARELALELERKCPPATASECGDWVESIAGDVLNSRAALVAEIESSATMTIGGDSSHVMSVLNPKETLGPVLAMSDHRASTHDVGSHTRNVVDGPPFTQPSSISVSSGSFGQQTPPMGSGGRRGLVLGVVLAMMGVSVLVTALIYRDAKRSASAPEPSVASAAASAASVVELLGDAASPSSASVEAQVPTSASAVPTNAASAEPAPDRDPWRGPAGAHVDAGALVVTKAAPKRHGAGVVKTSTPAPVPTPADDCTTPYWYDAAGVKRYKSQCLTNK